MEVEPYVKGFWAAAKIGILGLLFTSCSSAKITIDVMRLPISPISEPVQRIALLNRVNVSEAQTIQFMNGHVVAQFNGVTDLLVNESLKRIELRFRMGQYFEAFDTNLIFIPKLGKFNGSNMPPPVVKKACQILKVDALVTIEAYTADMDTDHEVYYSTPVDNLYGTVRMPYFDGEQSVDMRMLFKTYLCSEPHGLLDEETLVGTQVSYSTGGSSMYEVNAKMGGSGSILVEAAHKIGDDYADQIAPRRERSSRKIYTSGNEQMTEAYRLVGLGGWQSAADIWHLLATSNNKKLAAHASYNLILAFEVFGDYKQAKEWAQLCIDNYQMKGAQQYLSLLERREQEVKEIKRLFPRAMF